jgi:hypothetical protein
MFFVIGEKLRDPKARAWAAGARCRACDRQSYADAWRADPPPGCVPLRRGIPGPDFARYISGN